MSDKEISMATDEDAKGQKSLLRAIPPAEAARLKALPKAEVHLHLEGCFEAALIAQWAKAEGVALPRPLGFLEGSVK